MLFEKVKKSFRQTVKVVFFIKTNNFDIIQNRKTKKKSDRRISYWPVHTHRHTHTVCGASIFFVFDSGINTRVSKQNIRFKHYTGSCGARTYACMCRTCAIPIFQRVVDSPGFALVFNYMVEISKHNNANMELRTLVNSFYVSYSF